MGNTDVVYDMAYSLWKYLEIAPPHFHPQCIPLLHRLIMLSENAIVYKEV